MGAPEKEGTLVGPLHSEAASKGFLNAIEEAKKEGGKILFGGEKWSGASGELAGGQWVVPTMIQYDTFENIKIVQKETFAPSEFSPVI